MPTDCVAGRELVCTEGLPVTLTDVPEGAELLVSIGIDPDHPLLDGAAPEDGSADPLDFEVDLFVRRILDDGDLCQPDTLGRCMTGSACLQDPVDDVEGLLPL